MIPTIFIDGEHWVPKSHADLLAEKLRAKQRSQQAHNHQFAAIADLWANLPASHADAPYAANPDAFRKHGLIARGYCDVDTVVFETHEQAIEAAPVIAKLARKAHGYALVIVRGTVVVCSTPHSQSYKAMGKEKFQESKQAVIDWACELLEVERVSA